MVSLVAKKGYVCSECDHLITKHGVTECPNCEKIKSLERRIKNTLSMIDRLNSNASDIWGDP
jgi:rubrerythrin